MRPVRTYPEAHRADEIGFAPAPDAGLRMRGDVGPIKGSVNRSERTSSGERGGILAVFRVAGAAARGRDEISPADCVTWRRRGRDRGSKEQDERG